MIDDTLLRIEERYGRLIDSDSSFAEGKNKSKDYRWTALSKREMRRRLKSIHQEMRNLEEQDEASPDAETTQRRQELAREFVAFRNTNWPGGHRAYNPTARSPDRYTADIDTPRTPTPTSVAPGPSAKGKESATSPGISNPYKITVAAKSRRDATRVVKRQQLVQRGCTELKGLIQTLKERLVYFETLFERCVEGVDWETAELDVSPATPEKRLRFAK